MYESKNLRLNVVKHVNINTILMLMELGPL